MTTLARKLKARGHDVVFISVLDSEPYVRAAQLPFIPYCEKEMPLGLVRQEAEQLSKLQGPHWPSRLHHTGPFHDGLGRIESDFPWDRLTGEPLVYASMGTLQNGLESVFSTIAQAVEQRPGMQLVLSTATASILSRSVRCQPTALL
jgi:UDP:flavonoid glycosyltransferase YjiC (YdhE family)